MNTKTANFKLLDEATSALDTANEKVKTLQKLKYKWWNLLGCSNGS